MQQVTPVKNLSSEELIKPQQRITPMVSFSDNKFAKLQKGNFPANLEAREKEHLIERDKKYIYLK